MEVLVGTLIIDLEEGIKNIYIENVDTKIIKDEQNNARSKAVRIISNYYNNKKNQKLWKNEIKDNYLTTKRFLKQNPNLIITRSDKGNNTVIMEKEEYIKEMNKLLEDKNTYSILNKNPINRFEILANNLTIKLQNESIISEEIGKNLISYNSVAPKLYGLRKTHKKECALRPVVSSIGSLCYKIAKFIHQTITDSISSKLVFSIKNSFEFADNIGEKILPEGYILVSLDVVDKLEQSNLVYKIPCVCDKCYIGQTKQKLKKRLEQHKNDCKPINAQKSNITALAEHHFTTGHKFKFDETNILDKEDNWACRRAFESLPVNFLTKVETSLTRLLLSKLSGNAYLVTERHRISKVGHLIERLKDAFPPSRRSNYYRGQLATELMRLGEHMLDYFSRVKELTQSVLDETTKNSVHVERRVELSVKKEGLDALVRGLPRDYKTALKFEYYSNFDEILFCLLQTNKQIWEEDSKMGILRTDRQIKDGKKRNASPTFGNSVANIRQIKENIVRENCHKPGHKESYCFGKAVCDNCPKQS
ncbi:hypothetical protein M0804_013207 [Polistes exclamans]|nr:hypothetical protein M0804_013207 [Polistes exclamans]